MVWFASDKRWNESVHIPDVVDVVDVEDVAVNFIVIPIYKTWEKMLESRPEDALVKLVKLVKL